MESLSSSSPDPEESAHVSDEPFTHLPANHHWTTTPDEQRRIMRFDEVRTLVIGERAVRFTPLEYRLMRLFLARVGELVLYDDLTRAIFERSDSPASRAALEKHLDRIRSKVRTVGLDLPGVTNYGCLLLWNTVRRSSR